MIPATGITRALGNDTTTAVATADVHNTRHSTVEKNCSSTPYPDTLKLTEITAIAKTSNYLNGITGVNDFRRVGIESQCNGIAILKNTRTYLPRLHPGDAPNWRYSGNDINQTFYDQLPREELLKGQVLARTEQTTAGAPLIALTAELGSCSEKMRIYFPELITAPLTRQEFAQANIQTSLDHFRTLFINHLTQTKLYSLREVIAAYNNTRPINALKLIIEDLVPLNIHSHDPVGRPSDYSFYSAPLAASFWWTQANLTIPFKNIKKLHQVLDTEDYLKTIFADIYNDSVFNKYFTKPLQTNPHTDAWLWHFLYLATSFGDNLGPRYAEDSVVRLPKFRLLNLRYSHHQLMMEILDDEGIDILSEKLLSDIFKRCLFINTIRKTLNHYHEIVYDQPTEQNPEFNFWLRDYLDDLTKLCNLRKKYGISRVYNASTNEPFILVDDRPHYLPFGLLNSFRGFRGDYYRFVLPTFTNDRGEACTVLERRRFSRTSYSVTQGGHHPFTCKSNWYSKPTEEEQKHLDLYWA